MRSRKMIATSLALVFGMAIFFGTANAEAISVSDSNLLSNQTVLTSSQYHTTIFPESGVVDGAAGDSPSPSDFLFAAGDTQRRLVISGFNSDIALIRLWTEPDFAPADMMVLSSTENITSVDWSTLDAEATFPTCLTMITGMTLNPMPEGDYTTWAEGDTAGSWVVSEQCGCGPTTAPTLYKDFLVSAPAGTQSLYFDFGSALGGYAGLSVRISEIQAFSAVPEPGTMALLFSGLLGMLSCGWRKRK